MPDTQPAMPPASEAAKAIHAALKDGGAPKAGATDATKPPAGGASTATGASGAATTTTTDPAPAGSSTATDKPAPGSRDVAAMLAAEKKLNAQREATKAEAAKLAEEKKQIESERARYREWQEQEALKEKDPVAYIKARGLDLARLNEAYLKQGEATPEEKLSRLADEKFEAFKKQQAEESKAAEEKRLQAEKERKDAELAEATKRFYESATEHVKGAGEKYPLTNAFESYQNVHRVIDRHFEQTGKVLSFDDAAEMIENDAFEQVKKAIANPAVRAKIAPLFQTEASAPAVDDRKPERKTLTNELAPGTKPPAVTQWRSKSQDALDYAKAMYEQRIASKRGPAA